MANETVQATGSYATCIASTSTTDGAFNTGTKTAIGSAIATEDLYPLLDFRADVTVGTPTAEEPIDLYRRPSDGTNQAPAPATDYLHDKVGSFRLDNATGDYYLYGIPNPDPNDEYHALNNSGATITFSVLVRGRTYGT
jgi:hypothetical protein